MNGGGKYIKPFYSECRVKRELVPELYNEYKELKTRYTSLYIDAFTKDYSMRCIGIKNNIYYDIYLYYDKETKNVCTTIISSTSSFWGALSKVSIEDYISLRTRKIKGVLRRKCFAELDSFDSISNKTTKPVKVYSHWYEPVKC